MNPSDFTREQLTQQLISRPPPSDATPTYAHFHKTLTHLLDLLAHHPAMAPNLQQTYETPAASKNKVYFMWDFTGRTLGQLLALKPQEPRDKTRSFEEMQGRALFGAVLITGPQDKLDAMIGGPKKKEFEFGDEIMKAANAVSNELDIVG